jgi:hypothetical protein
MRTQTFLLSLVITGLLALSCSPRPTGDSTAPTAPVTPKALPESGYKLQWVNVQAPTEMLPGREYSVSATIKNAGDQTWPSKGTGGGPVNQVLVSYHWLPAQGEKAIVWEGVRTALPNDVSPGQTITMNNIRIVAPAEAGSYRLQLTLVHEGVTWFEVHGQENSHIEAVAVR